MEFIANKTENLSRKEKNIRNYWQKYLTLQHCEWTCFVKFLLFWCCYAVLSLCEWLIDYASLRYDHENDFFFCKNNVKKSRNKVKQGPQQQMNFRIWCKLEKFIQCSLFASTVVIENERLSCWLIVPAPNVMMNHMTWHCCSKLLPM
jgi:hypothetical protein